jgi:hypothetical protein
MFAVWSDRPSDLLDAGLRSTLARTGVLRLVVNLDDADVADAQLRLTTYDRPVDAVVSLWIEGADTAEQVIEVLRPPCTRLAGWVVDSREPLPPPEVPDGVRADALVNIALLRIPPGMERGEWLRVWQEQHTTVAIETQATFGYVQNTVVRPLTAGQPPVDALVEEFFPMRALTDLHAFYGSGGDEAELHRRLTRMLESVSTFGASENLDVVPSSRYAFTLRDDEDPRVP